VTAFAATKATLAVMGILVFAYGIHYESMGIRWAGIATLAVAFLLRFIDPARRR